MCKRWICDHHKNKRAAERLRHAIKNLLRSIPDFEPYARCILGSLLDEIATLQRVVFGPGLVVVLACRFHEINSSISVHFHCEICFFGDYQDHRCTRHTPEIRSGSSKSCAGSHLRAWPFHYSRLRILGLLTELNSSKDVKCYNDTTSYDDEDS